ncbi:MAG TPA: hypothetical protein VMZ53_00415, partial [Kofleriaceae bacterium]|nr:hypothetical protein [Kofleriaceae bacterium]
MRIALACLLASGCDALFGVTHISSTTDGSTDGVNADAMSCHASSVTANAGHSCAVRDDHGVSCWGNNTQNEIGTITGSISCQASGTQF